MNINTIILFHCEERKVANAFKMMRAIFEDKQDKINVEQKKRMEALIKRTMRKKKELYFYY